MKSILLAWLALALPLAAQETTPTEAEVKEALRALDERWRDELHPSEDPLVVVGREQGDNDLRTRTPALARSDRVAAKVDEEDAYARALALYEGTALHAPPRNVSAGVEPIPDERSRKAVAREGGAATEDEGSSTSRWLPIFLGAALSLGLVLRHILRR